MSTHIRADILIWRSLLFVPANNPRFIDKAHTRGADAIILDLAMPEINGWEVGKAIRSICHHRGRPKPPFILLTGWGGQELEKGRIADSGVDAVVEKPVEIATLLKVVRDVSERQ